jgi:hypothetical protein
MAAWLDCFSLSSIDPPTGCAPPGEWGQGQYFLLQRVVGGDRHFSRAVHFRHFSQKVRPMIRTTLQEIELPLMNHFMSDRVQELLFRIRRSVAESHKKWKRQANFSTALTDRCPWPTTAGEHTDGGGQARTPQSGDRRKSAGEISSIQILPTGLQLGPSRENPSRLTGPRPPHPTPSITDAASSGSMISWWPVKE